MNANRRRANLRMDQLRRRLHATHGNHIHALHWRSLIRVDRECPPLRPLGAWSSHIRTNLFGRDGSHETDAYVRDWTRRVLAALRNHQPIPNH